MKRIFLISTILLCISVSEGCRFQKQVQTDLYFGLSQPDQKIISDSAWNVFVKDHVSQVFSAGFTVINGEGKWQDMQSRQIISEPSRIVISVNKMTGQLSIQIDSLREVYRQKFQQQSVLRVDRKVTSIFNNNLLLTK